MGQGKAGVCALGRQGRGGGGLGAESRRKGQVEEAIPAPTTALEEKPGDLEEKWWGCSLEEGPGRATLTGLMSRCRKPTEWMASMDSKICLPSRSVVLSVKVPRGWLRRRSARFRPWGWRRGLARLGCPAPFPVAPLNIPPSLIPKGLCPLPTPMVTSQAFVGEEGGPQGDSPGAASLRN